MTGLLIAVQKEYFNILNYKELHFNDCGDRVAQLLHVELAFPFSKWRNGEVRQEILIVNTHLLFPHDATLSLVRLKQVFKRSNMIYKNFPVISCILKF
jgi:hypothetical protein